MTGVNRAIIVGRLGRDVDLRFSQQGTAVANFSVATSEEWYDKASGEKKERTEWHRIVNFGKQAENCDRFLSKGSLVYIEGKLQTRDYEKDGQRHYITEIVANTVQFLSKNNKPEQPQNQYSDDDNAARNAAGFTNNPTPNPESDPDIPF